MKKSHKDRAEACEHIRSNGLDKFCRDCGVNFFNPLPNKRIEPEFEITSGAGSAVEYRLEILNRNFVKLAKFLVEANNRLNK